jgi:hypothetical protein
MLLLQKSFNASCILVRPSVTAGSSSQLVPPQEKGPSVSQCTNDCNQLIAASRDLDGGYVIAITEIAAAKLKLNYLQPDHVVGEFEVIQRKCALTSHPSLTRWRQCRCVL